MVFRPVNTTEAGVAGSRCVVMLPTLPYVCMPYLAHRPLADGALVAAVTYNVASSAEGHPDQHVGLLRSTDNGATWTMASVLGTVGDPESSWGMLWLDDNDDLYAFYNFNYQNVRTEPNGSPARVDCVGCIAWRKSTDGGLTWGARNLLQIPSTSIDARNPWGGSKVMSWLTGHPVKGPDGKLYIGLSKVATKSFTDTEAFVMRMAVPPTQASIELLPPIKVHTRPANQPGIQEEPSQYVHGDGLISVVYRTDTLRLHEAWMEPGANVWQHDYARRLEHNLGIYNSRSMNTIFPMPDGRFLLFCYNNIRVTNQDGQTGENTRTPSFYRIGERVGSRILWGQEYLLAYNSGTNHESYVSFCLSGFELLLACTDKATCWLCRYDLHDL